MSSDLNFAVSTIENHLLGTPGSTVRIMRSPYAGNGGVLVSHDQVGETSGATLGEALSAFAEMIVSPPTTASEVESNNVIAENPEE